MSIDQRQEDQLLGHVEMLLDRVRHLRDQDGALAPSEDEIETLFTAIEDFELLEDPTVLEAHSFLRGLAAGFGLESLRDIYAYSLHRRLSTLGSPVWVRLLQACDRALAYLAATSDRRAIEIVNEFGRALASWRGRPWR